MNKALYQKIGKKISLISFIIMLILGIVFLFVLDNETYKLYLKFLEIYVYAWITLSSFIGVSGMIDKGGVAAVLRAVRGVKEDYIDNSDINESESKIDIIGK